MLEVKINTWLDWIIHSVRQLSWRAIHIKWARENCIKIVLTSLLPFPLMWMGGGVITDEFFICLAWGLLLKTLLLSLTRGERKRDREPQINWYKCTEVSMNIWTRCPLTAQAQAEWGATCVYGFWVGLVYCQHTCCVCSLGLSPCPACCLDHGQAGWS